MQSSVAQVERLHGADVTNSVPIRERQTAARIGSDDFCTRVLLQEYADHTFVVVSQVGKIGCLVSPLCECFWLPDTLCFSILLSTLHSPLLRRKSQIAVVLRIMTPT